MYYNSFKIMKKVLSIVILLAISVSVFAQDGKKYEIKSGIVKTVTEVMGQKVEATAYFDNYGAIEASKTKTPSPMGELDLTTISKDGKTYVVNHTMKNVQTVPQQQEINFLNLTDEVIKQYKVVMIGIEKIGERECSKYIFEMSMMGQTISSTAWVWKGITLKSVSQANGMTITVNVTELQEDAAIDASIFDVPTF